MPDQVSRLFDDYAARWARGEHPDPRPYLIEAGEAQEELRTLIERFVSAVPPRAPSEDSVAMVRAWMGGEPPLLELRRRRGLKREAVVGALVERLGLDPRKKAKVADYYHQLESGDLDPERVDRRVFAALAEALKARVDDILAWPGRTVAAEARYYRVDASLAAPGALAQAAPPPIEPEWDEIDRLFRGDR